MASTPYYPAAPTSLSPGAHTSLLPPGLAAQDATVLFVHAHPDDESSSTGATMAALAQAGASVYLLTMTRGEMGEVIEPSLKHLEAKHPQNKDAGAGLGILRSSELAAACQQLGVAGQVFLGEGDSYVPGERTRYLDSGMTWDKEGRATADPAAPEDCLTRLPLAPQAAGIVALIESIRPQVLVTYDADGGYGHPDHKRTHEAVAAAMTHLEGRPEKPQLFWGLESEPQVGDSRPQALIQGDLEAKRKAMQAHATQITITGPESFEYSNGVPQAISPIEGYRLLAGDLQPPAPENAPEDSNQPGLINSLVTALAVGLLAGFAGSMYQSHIWYFSSGAWLPYGSFLACLLVFFAVCWVALYTGRRWAASLTGTVVFALIGAFAYAVPGSLLVYIAPGVNPVGSAGALWAFGSLLATCAGLLTAVRHQAKNPRNI